MFIRNLIKVNIVLNNRKITMKINSIKDERVLHARQLATSKGRLEYQIIA